MARLRALRSHPVFAALALLSLITGSLLLTRPAHAADLRVAVGDLAGPRVGRNELIALQRALTRLGGVEIQSTGDFKKQAGAMQVSDIIPQDAAALTDVSGVLEVDVVLYGAIVPPDDRTWPGARDADKVMLVSVYSGRDGRFVAEEVVRIRDGRLNDAVWRAAATAVEPYLGDAATAAPPPEPDRRSFRPEPVEPLPPVRDRTRTPEDLDLDTAGNWPLVRLAAGLALLSRDFDYTAAPDSPLFAAGGVQYASSLVPGFALDAEFFPLSRSLDGPARGIGVGITFEKVFLDTDSTITGPDGTQQTASLETSHSHLLPRVIYRYFFPGGTEIGGQIGLGFLTFSIQDNPEYNGVAYTYLTLGASGRIPLGSPVLAVDLRAAVLPWVGVGDSAAELGGEASSSGFQLYGGIATQVDALSIQIGVEYTGISSDITGEGRGGRIGVEATDRYVGARLMAGYRF